MPAAPGRWPWGSTALGKWGERERRVRGSDSLPQLGRRWSEVAWPRQPMGGGWQWPRASVLEARRRSRRGGEARGDPEGAIPYLGSGWGAAERAGHGGRRRRAELLGAAVLEGRGGVLEVVDRLWSSEAR